MSTKLLELLGAERGVVCAVGAGGKKTTLYRIAQAHTGRVGITTTVFMAPFPSSLKAECVIAPRGELVPSTLAAAQRARVVAFAHESSKQARYGGLSSEEIEAVRAQRCFDVLLIKADGARMRSIKAPAADEPVLPAAVDTVLYLVSAAALGSPLDEEVAHRVELLEGLTGARRDQPIEPVHVARLLASEQGALKDVGQAQVVPVINMVDDETRLALAHETARLALQLTDRYDYIVLASMRAEQPIIECLKRQTGPG